MALKIFIFGVQPTFMKEGLEVDNDLSEDWCCVQWRNIARWQSSYRHFYPSNAALRMFWIKQISPRVRDVQAMARSAVTAQQHQVRILS